MESFCSISAAGNKFWKNAVGRRHREDGPAIEWQNGRNEWWRNGKRHRLDGPAIVWEDSTANQWYINGHHMKPFFYDWTKEMSIDLDNLTDDDKSIIVITWGNYNGN